MFPLVLLQVEDVVNSERELFAHVPGHVIGSCVSPQTPRRPRAPSTIPPQSRLELCTARAPNTAG